MWWETMWWEAGWLFACSDAEVYRLRHDEHLALVKRLRASIDAHVRLLTKVRISDVRASAPSVRVYLYMYVQLASS